MAEHGIPKLGLEPGAFGWHDAASVGDGHEFLYPGRKHREGAGVFSTINESLQLSCPTDASDKTDARVGSRIGDAKNWVQHVVLQQRNVELFDRVGRRREAWTKVQGVPFARNIESKFM